MRHLKADHPPGLQQILARADTRWLGRRVGASLDFASAISKLEDVWECRLSYSHVMYIAYAFVIQIERSAYQTKFGHKKIQQKHDRRLLKEVKSIVARDEKIAKLAGDLAVLLKEDHHSGVTSSALFGFEREKGVERDFIRNATEIVEKIANRPKPYGEVQRYLEVRMRRKTAAKVGRKPAKDGWTKFAQSLIKIYEQATGCRFAISASQSYPHLYGGNFFFGLTSLYEAMPRSAHTVPLQTIGSRCEQIQKLRRRTARTTRQKGKTGEDLVSA